MTPNLTIADTLTGAPGAIVSVPISISDATGLQSLQISLKYDTNILTIPDPTPETDSNEGVKKTGIAENWILTQGEGDNPNEELPNPTANVRENLETGEGEVTISLINPGSPLTETSGEIVEIDFQVNSNAAFCLSAAIDVQEARFGIDGEDAELTVGNSDLDDGSLTVKPNIENSIPVQESEFEQNPLQYMTNIQDFDGNNLGASESWKQIGEIDVQGDGDTEYVFVNPEIGRWATVGADITGTIDFGDHSWCGDTRVVGIYEDPLIALGLVEKDSDFDSQRRFQNDLLIDNLTLISNSGLDYDGDSLQEVYFKVNDGTAVLHAYMHADGNIQYANYQSEADLEQFMTDNGIDSAIWSDWF